jgi:protein SCO1/2
MGTVDVSENHSAHSEMEMEANTPTDESIYNVSSVWKNRNGNEIELSNLQGEIQIVTMVYTHCEFACPRILADMKRVEKELSQEELSDINFLIVSIDPERDTPERLKKFAGENNLSLDNWTLLNGSQGDILELSALLGVKYKKISETDFTHSNMLTVLNQEGEIIHQRMKLGNDTSPILASIRQAL